MTSDSFQRKLTAILSADVVGYSRLMGDDEAATVKTLETYKGVMFSLIKQHRGRVVDSPGDNLLAEFGSVVDAVQCAVSIQKELQTRNADLPENRRMEFRIGINLGDVIEEEDRIYGDGVNIAARLEALADPGGICISKTAFDYIENKLPFGYRFIGEQTVKNIAKPVGAYKVLMETRVVDSRTKREAKTVSLWRRTAVLCLGIILLLVFGGILYWNFYLRGPSIEPASVERMAYPLPDKPSIAVLPFTNMSGDPEQDYIGDGLSENIISALSVSSEIFVIARNTTFTYKGKAVDIKQVAEDLGVQYLLEGSVQKSGNQLRVTAQLIDALSGHHLWSEVYDREMKNLFDLQDEITKEIMVSLQVVLSGSEEVRVYAKSTANLEAWKHYIKGVELFEKANAKDNLKAREHFEAAIKIDPAFVAALSMLAETHFRDFDFEWVDSPLTSLNRASELSQKAVELDEQDPYAHTILGRVFLYQRQYEKAITECKRAITLNPNYVYGHGILAETLYYTGRFDESITLCKKASRLNPIDPSFYLHFMAVSYIFLGRYEEALEAMRQMEAYVPPGSRLDVLSKQNLSWVYQELGREEEARAYMAEALKIKPDFSLENFLTEPYKDPAHLKRMLDALREAGMPENSPGAVQEKPSIAVLPFIDISPEKDQEYFVDGLSEEILNGLCQIPDLTVIARTSSFSFKGQNKTIQEIAKILNVDHVLEGSVRKAGNNIRITAQLINAVDGSHLWSKAYDKPFKVEEIFSVQEDIASKVADELKLTLGIGSLRQLGGTDNTAAYEYYLNAKGQLYNRQEENALRSIDSALLLDPEFALAWALKATAHSRISGGAVSNSRIVKELDESLRSAQKAIELEPNLAEAHFAPGRYNTSKLNWINAELAYQKAFELTTDVLSRNEFEPFFHYMCAGYFEKAKRALEAQLKNDSFNMNSYYYYLNILVGYVGDIQRAKEENERAKKLFKEKGEWPGDDVLIITRISRGEIVPKHEIDEERLAFHNAIGIDLESPEKSLEAIHKLYIEIGEEIPAGTLGTFGIYAAFFGDYDFAMDLIEKSGVQRVNNIIFLWIPVMKEARQLPRFKEFVREIGLIDYWKEYGWNDFCRPVGDDDFACD